MLPNLEDYDDEDECFDCGELLSECICEYFDEYYEDEQEFDEGE